MESFQHLDATARTTYRNDSVSEFVTEINQIVAYMNRNNHVDLAMFCSNEFKSMKKYTLSEKNLKFLDDLSKFCSLFLWFDPLTEVNGDSNDEYKKDLKRNFVANVALGSIFDNVSKENSRLLKQIEELDVRSSEENPTKHWIQWGKRWKDQTQKEN